MRKPIMAGNWKMNKTRDEALQFIFQVNDKLPSNEEVETVICAPAIILRDLVKRQGDNLRIGAQNMHQKGSGAYTGEISASMLTSTGVEYVILGHSERRQYFNETDLGVHEKTVQALKNDLKPIVCVGETLEEKEAGSTNQVLEAQVVGALKDVKISNPENVIIAYEPVWAIGTGKSASSKDANDGCAFIRSVLANLFGEVVASKIRILYGGSVKPSTVNELYAEADIDGFLVGGASLNPTDYLALCNACVSK